MRLMKRGWLLAAVLVEMLVSGPCAAQGGLRDMETDRPNQTNTPSTIDRGHVQVEIGAFDTTLDREDGDRTRMWSIGEANVRVGLSDEIEFNLIVPAHVVLHEREGGDQTRARGLGDVTAGLKWNLWGNDGEGATALAIQPQVKLPTAGDTLGNGHVEVDLNVPFHADGPAGFGLSVQPTLSLLRSEENTHDVAGWQGAVAVDHDLGPANLYVEYLAADTAEHRAPAVHQLDLGGVVALGENIVLDAGTEIGLSEGADDFRVLTGLSVRF